MDLEERAALRGRAFPAGKKKLRPVTLKKNKEFGYAYRKGKSLAAKSIVCICTTGRYGGLKAGFVVSKKIGNSVTRNLIRRRLKEAYRMLLPEIRGNHSIVFIAREAVLKRSFKELRGDMRYLLKKHGLTAAREN